MAGKYSTTDYRYPYEYLILAATILVVLLVIAFTAAATVCTSAIFVPAVVIFGYYASRSKHQALLADALQVTPQSEPDMMPLLQQNYARLQVEPVNVFIVRANQLNAYTFGMDSPKAIVLYASLFKLMDRDEIQFILGHEMGHVKLGHTWLNTLVGGMAGIPSGLGAAAIMELAFRWWNRACEYSADRAGVLACGKPNKAITALVKLEAGASALSQSGMQAAIQHIDREDDDLMNKLEELIASHPMVAKRIEQIRSFTRSNEYRQMQALMDRNLPA
ncbi:MAG TPA: M48 family metallopeptidase [Anaerolineales bacterium]|nr:M48 family metallopeptidase [Anaerolineales bacterium]